MANQDQTWNVNTATPGEAIIRRWWSVRKDAPGEAGRHMVEMGKTIERGAAHLSRMRRSLIFAKLYANQDLTNVYQMASARGPEGPTWDVLGHRVSFNVARSCVRTQSAKICKNRPRPCFLTSKGNYEQRLRAKGLTRFMDGLFYATEMYEGVGRPVFRDGGVFDSGACKLIEDYDEGQVRIERILPTELLVDERDGIYGKPRSMIHRQYVPKDWLTWAYTHKLDSGTEKARIERAIAEAKSEDPLQTSDRGRASDDMVAVYEGWHIQSGKGAGDGRHIIAVEGYGGTLLDEDWDRDYFPVLLWKYDDRIAGVWGQSIVEMVCGFQLEMNKVIRTIQAAQHIVSVPRVWVEEGSEVDGLGNTPGAIGFYRGTPPTISTAQAMHPEIYQWVERIYRGAFEEIGRNEMSVTGQKPAGITSGVGIRESTDVDSEQSLPIGQRWEKWYMDVADVAIDMMRRLKEGGHDVHVLAPKSRDVEALDWSQVDMKRDSYVMQAYPTAMLPTQPAARLQRVTEMVEAGFIDREAAMGMLDFPDLEAETSLYLASRNAIDRIIDAIIEHGRYEVPEPFIDLQLALKRAQLHLLLAQNEGVPEKRLDLLRRWIDEVYEEIKAQAPQQPAAVPGMPAAPGAPAMPPGAPATVDPMAMGGALPTPDFPQQPIVAPQIAIPPGTNPALPSDAPVLAPY